MAKPNRMLLQKMLSKKTTALERFLGIFFNVSGNHAYFIIFHIISFQPSILFWQIIFFQRAKYKRKESEVKKRKKTNK